MERLDQDQCRAVKEAFEAKHEGDLNINEVCMRYNVCDGDWLQVKVKDIWAAKHIPEMFNGHNVFVEEAPAVRVPLPQG